MRSVEREVHQEDYPCSLGYLITELTAPTDSGG